MYPCLEWSMAMAASCFGAVYVQVMNSSKYHSVLAQTFAVQFESWKSYLFLWTVDALAIYQIWGGFAKEKWANIATWRCATLMGSYPKKNSCNCCKRRLYKVLTSGVWIVMHRWFFPPFLWITKIITQLLSCCHYGEFCVQFWGEKINLFLFSIGL